MFQKMSTAPFFAALTAWKLHDFLSHGRQWPFTRDFPGPDDQTWVRPDFRAETGKYVIHCHTASIACANSNTPIYIIYITFYINLFTIYRSLSIAHMFCNSNRIPSIYHCHAAIFPAICLIEHIQSSSLKTGNFGCSNKGRNVPRRLLLKVSSFRSAPGFGREMSSGAQGCLVAIWDPCSTRHKSNQDKTEIFSSSEMTSV